MFNITMKTKPPTNLSTMTQDAVKITKPQDLNFHAHTVAMRQAPQGSGSSSQRSVTQQQPQRQGYSNTQQQSQRQGYSNTKQQPQRQGYSNTQQPQRQGYTNSPQPVAPAAPPARRRPPLPAPVRLLRKGEKFSLTKNAPSATSLRIGIGWDFSASVQYDVDIEAFMLGADEKVPGDEWIVFYGQLQSPDSAVKHRGDSSSSGLNEADCEQIDIDLSKVDKQITKIALVVTINEAKLHGYNFSGIKDAYIRISDNRTGKEIVRYELTDYYREVVSMVVGEIYFRNNEWRFNPVGMGTGDDLEGLCNRYGIEVK